MGQSFASRVAASQLMALNLAELVTSTVEEYELLAVELAHNQDRLAKIKSKISSHRSTSPLFNTERFTRQLEKAYTGIFERHQAGLPPAHVNIEPSTTGENKTIAVDY
jgi:predicted O-linked N-acetylglucosamine transferase (SPINDLY family)